MSLIIDDIKDVIWESINNFIKVPLMFEDQKIIIPESGVFGTIKLTTLPLKEGQDSQKMSGTILTISGQRNLTCSVNFYRKGSIQLMHNLRAYLDTALHRYKLHTLSKSKDVKLALIDALAIQDLSILVQSDFEERSQMDIRYRAVESLIDEGAGYIEKTDINGEYQRGEGDPNPINDNTTIQ